ncbi:MAG: Hpt domain-containing protein [Alphaproteobacteria bacterium]|nr:Hpt domain-containing protein [Alphaproteobacteria bacterium]
MDHSEGGRSLRRHAEPKPRAAPIAAVAAKPFPDIDPAIFDVARLAEAFGVIDADARSFLQGFLDAVPGMVGTIEAALASRDLAAGRDAAHALKGAARSAGAVRLGQLASDLQDVLDAEDYDTAGLLHGLLDTTYQELVGATQSLR